MIIDLSTCVGCNACTVACKAENGTPSDIWFAPVFEAEVGKFPNSKVVFLPTLCNHCEDPPCMKACPSHAIYKRNDGIVLVDENKCCGAQACVSACPYGAIYFPDPKATEIPGVITPFEAFWRERRKKQNVAMKCTFCAHKIGPDGKYTSSPACVETCPVSCRIFGDLDDPKSKPSSYLEKKSVSKDQLMTLRPSAQTGPNVQYIPFYKVTSGIKTSDEGNPG